VGILYCGAREGSVHIRRGDEKVLGLGFYVCFM
jgi:hypothetical protein